MHFYETGETHLFNLANDIAERNDLAQEKPELVHSMRESLLAYLKEVDAQMPEKNPGYDPDNPPSLRQKNKVKKGGGGGKGKKKGKGNR